MANQFNRRLGRDRYGRDRGPDYGRQAEQFEDASWRQREDERQHGQMGEAWDRDDEYSSRHTVSQAPPRFEEARSADYHPGRETGYSSGNFGPAHYSGTGARGFASFTGSDQGGRDFSGPRYNYGPGRSPATPYGPYGGGSYGEGTYGGASAGEYNEHGRRGWFERAGDEVASWFGDEEASYRREQDHSGKGPAGYTRSDERILEDVCDSLTEDWAVDAGNIEVSVREGNVTLDGSVTNRSHKRRAEDVVEDLSGVKNVQNNLRVRESTAWDRNNSGQAEPTG